MEAILSGGLTGERPGTAPAHTRLIVAITMILAVVLSDHPCSFAGYFLVAVALWMQSPMGFTQGLKRLMVIDSVVLLTILPLPFSFIDEQVVLWGPLTLSETGVLKAQEIFIKATISAIVMMSQCCGMSGLDLSRALYTLKVPTKFILLLQFSIRYITVMQQELSSLRMAMRARGFGNGPVLQNWRSYGYLFGMLLIRALARADLPLLGTQGSETSLEATFLHLIAEQERNT